MAVVRLTNGSDIVVKLSVTEALAAVQADDVAFVELPGDEGPIHVRPSGIIAVIEDARRGTTGFRIGIGQSASAG